MSFMPYVDFEQGTYTGHHIVRLGCMLCNDTIGSKNPITNEFYFWDHKRDIKVIMSDGSIALVPVCDKCLIVELTPGVLSHLDNTIKYGWLSEQSWAFKKFPKRTTGPIINAGKFAKSIFVVRRGN